MLYRYLAVAVSGLEWRVLDTRTHRIIEATDQADAVRTARAFNGGAR